MDGSLGDVQQALQDLDAAGSARIRSRLRSPRSTPARNLRDRIRTAGAGWIALFALFRVLDVVLRLGRRRPEPTAWSPGDAVGVVDLRHHRACLDYGAYAILEKDGRQWHGASGAPLTDVLEGSDPLHPLWLIDLLRGAHAATQSDTPADDTRRFTVHVDIAAAVATSGHDLALPAGSTYRGLSRLPLIVETRNKRLASIRFKTEWADFAIEFIDYGDELDVDWSRLPCFEDERARVFPRFGLRRKAGERSG